MKSVLCWLADNNQTMNSKRNAIALMCAVAGLCSSHAAVTGYEPFNYPLTNAFPNNTPTTGIGFTGNWTVANTPSIVAGLTYTNLPTAANAYQHSATAGRTFVNFSNTLSGGTEYVSFLIKGNGNSGGDTVGIFLKGDTANSLFVGFRTPFSASQTGFGLGSVSSTALSGAVALGAAINIINNTTHLIVLKIDFNTAGANETISMWIDPPAGTNAPGVAANVTYSSFDVGNISAFGINIQGGYTTQVDEVRRGNSYGDVVGNSVVLPPPTIATTVVISSAVGKQLSWSAASTNNYQPQRSGDNVNWTNIGALLTGSAVTSVYDSSSAPYYRVLEVTPGGPGANVVLNGSFEDTSIPVAANWTSSPNTAFESVWVTNTYGALGPVSGTNFMYMEGTTAPSAPTAPNTYLSSDAFPVVGGLSYNVKFNAANPVKVGGANPQYRIRYFDSGNIFISETYASFASAGNTWTLFSVTNTAPVNAAKMDLFFIQAVGAGASWDWVTLIDNVSVNATATFGGTNVLSPVIKSGLTFTGTVRTNGVTATATTGTLTFQTNSVQLSANVVAAGTATSGTAILLPPYTVTAIYSGDSTYIGSTNTVTVNSTTATVTLGNLSQTYDGTARQATATVTPSGLAVALTYNGSANAPTNPGTYQVIGTVVDNDYQGSATNNLVVSGDFFGNDPGSVSVAGGTATVILSGIEGKNYSVQRATDVLFTQGVKNFPTATAPAGGQVSVSDDFSDLGTMPNAAFYRLQYIP